MKIKQWLENCVLELRTFTHILIKVPMFTSIYVKEMLSGLISHPPMPFMEIPNMAI